MARDDILTKAGGFLLALALIPVFWPLGARAAPLCGDAVGSKCVFVTSDRYGSQLRGLEGADQKCADEARAEGSMVAPGTYKAWLSTEQSYPAGTRFTHPSVPYVRVDGVQVAASFAALTSAGQLDAPISVTATGQPSDNRWAWTSTRGDGTPLLRDCTGWNYRGIEPEGRGIVGSTRDRVGWTGAAERDYESDCMNFEALYCFQQ